MPACVWALIWLTAASSLSAEPIQTALMRNGEIVRGELSGGDELPAFSVQSAETISLVQIRRISFTRSAFVRPISGPLRRFEFASGDRVTGALVAYESDEVAIDVRGGRRIGVPVAAIRSIETLSGTRDRVYEDFERDDSAGRQSARARLMRIDRETSRRSLALESGVWDWSMTDSAENAQLSCWFRPPAPMFRAGRAGLEVTFGLGESRKALHVGMSPSGGTLVVTGTAARRLAVQPLTLRDGWQKLTVRADRHRLQILADERLLAAGERPSGSISRVALFHAAAQDVPPDVAADRAIVFDDLLLQSLDDLPVIPPRFAIADQDGVGLRDGGRLFGRVVAADSQGVTLEAIAGPVELGWNELGAVRWARRKSPSSSIDGVIARIVLYPPSDVPQAEADVLHAAIRNVAEAALEIEHPVLGTLRLPFEQIERIEPEFIGTRIGLGNGPYHLGDELRPRFQHPAPEGARLEGTFELETPPSGEIDFAADVSELEPSGPGTPRGSRFLTELREGGLLTELWINNTRVGALNHQIDSRTRAGAPERFRLRIPRELLRRGSNEWRIEQRPARGDAASFNDCEVQGIALEIRRPSLPGATPLTD